MNIVILGAHPDDPESTCGGLIVKAIAQGHRVTAVYLTNGLPDCRVNSPIRRREATEACEVLGCGAHFMEYPDAAVPFDRKSMKEVSDLMRDLDADLVIGHWPVDTHPDHQAAGSLATQAVVGNPDVALAYCDVATGIQTLSFTPNRYVDISGKPAEIKKRAVECHVSQNVSAWWHFHDVMEKMRGFEHGVERAEAFHLAVSTPLAESIFETRGFLCPSGGQVRRDTKHQVVNL